MKVEYKIVQEESGFAVHCYNNNQLVSIITKCDKELFATEQEALEYVNTLTS